LSTERNFWTFLSEEGLSPKGCRTQGAPKKALQRGIHKMGGVKGGNSLPLKVLQFLQGKSRLGAFPKPLLIGVKQKKEGPKGRKNLPFAYGMHFFTQRGGEGLQSALERGGSKRGVYVSRAFIRGEASVAGLGQREKILRFQGDLERGGE